MSRLRYWVLGCFFLGRDMVFGVVTAALQWEVGACRDRAWLFGVATWTFGSPQGQACGRVAIACDNAQQCAQQSVAVHTTVHVVHATERAACTHCAHDLPCDNIQCCALFRVTVWNIVHRHC